MIQPIRPFLLLLLTGLLLALVVWWAPEGGWKLAGDWKIKVFAYQELVPKKRKKTDKQMKALLAMGDTNQMLQAPSAAATPETIADSAQDDSAQKPQVPKVLLSDADSLLPRIEYPNEKPGALDPLFEALDSIPLKKDVVRLLHIGDSQIEGDRITAYLRHRFQGQFGGCGVGLVPIQSHLESRHTLKHQTNEQWRHYLAYGKEKKLIHHKLSLFKSSFRLKTFEVDSSQTDSAGEPQKIYRQGPTQATAQFQTVSRWYPRNGTFRNLKVFYRNPQPPFQMELQLGEHFSLQEDFRDTLKGFETYRYDVPKDSTFKKVKLTFTSDSTSPDIYGVAFDCNKGVAFDNIALRGSSGLEFTKIDFKFLRQQLQQLNARFLILQFGVNVAPYDREEFDFYERLFYVQLRRLKRAMPNLPILVVGISDMSKKKGTEYVTYPSVPKIRKAQRNAAFKAGCAFWDLYQAMGGKNSMPFWVEHDPPLAASDYTHFSNRGARIVAEMLYKVLMLEYRDYRDRHPENS